METILLLEAISNHAQMMRTHLEQHNYKVLVSPSATQAREILEKQSADLLVIDLNIADDEFFKFYNWIRENPEIALIPRLFISGKMQQDIAEQLETGHKETILNKPLDVNRFISTIERLKAGISPILRKNRKQDYFETLIGKKIGTAIILKEIDRGGMGVVFLGHQENLDRKVAVKLLLPEMMGDVTAIERFQREAMAIARLKSPHIVQIYDSGELDTHVFYITMEYIPGHTVDYILRHKGRFPLAKALSVITQVANGLMVAHDAGLIHRDIKPSNLIMDNKGHVTITDFGLVRTNKKTRHTQAGMVLGTPHYLPPEQSSGKALDARSDIYSLGIVLFHLLVGHPPFLSDNPMEIMMKHMGEPLPDPRKFVPSIPQEMVDILERMTAKNPEQRYINCRELLWDLRASEIDDTQDVSFEKETKKNTGTALSHSTVDTSLLVGHSELRKQFPVLFTHENIVGTMTLSDTGTLLNIQGRFPEEWKNAIYILQESTIQLNAAAQLGYWQFKLVETPEEMLALFPEGVNLGSMLVSQKESYFISSSSLQSSTSSFLNVTHPGSPVMQIAAIAGVTDIMLFAPSGQLVDYTLSKPASLDIYKLRFAPVAQIMQSISFKISGMDLWFEKGRILSYTLDTGILFIIASLGVSRPFLSIYIASHLEQLNNMIRTAVQEAANHPFSLVTQSSSQSLPKEVVNPVPLALMESIQLELAHFIGPIAKVVLMRECKTLGYTKAQFPGDKLLELGKNVANLLDEAKRQQFRDKIQAMIDKFGSKQ